MTKLDQEQPGSMRPRGRIPHFNSVAEEAEFWDAHSTTEFEDEFEPVEDVRFVVRRDRPKRAISIRLPEAALQAVAERAHEQGIGPSTLIRMWILERLRSQP